MHQSNTVVTDTVLGINGLGRIGKLSLWRHIALGYFKTIVVNTGREFGKSLYDLASYIESDSTYGQLSRYLYGFKGDQKRPIVKIIDEKEGKLKIDNTDVYILRTARNPKDIEWSKYDVSIVVDTTGKFTDPSKPADVAGGALRGHLEAGARKVINSSAFKMKTNVELPKDAVTLIYGINQSAFNSYEHHIISAASCTTTALAHMLKPILENEKTKNILTASMSTIHSTTNTQSVLDKPPKAGSADLRKNRMVLDNIILTSTNAARALGTVIPVINNIGFMADSVRIPTSTVSLITLNLTVQSGIDENENSSVTREIVNNILKEASDTTQKGLIVYSEEQKVSTDYKGVDAAVVIEAHDTHTRTAFINVNLKEMGIALANQEVLRVPVTHVKLFGWYDNELGSYTNRLADLTIFVDQETV